MSKRKSKSQPRGNAGGHEEKAKKIVAAEQEIQGYQYRGGWLPGQTRIG
jgi:hypothetical protein